MISPIQNEIAIRAVRPGRKRNGSLPWLYNWQYGRALYSEDDFYAMINANKGWVYVATSRNATSVASTPLRLYVAKNKKGNLKGYPTKSVDETQEKYIRENAYLQNLPTVRKAVEFEEILDHPFLDLKKNVNPFMNNFDLMEITSLYTDLTGNTFWYLMEDRLGIPREIWVIPPQNCKIIPDKKAFISGYKYIKGNDEINLKERNVIHFKLPNTKNAYYGASALSSIAEEFNLSKSINAYETAMFANQGVLSGVLETEQELGDHEYERLKQEIKDTFTGERNTGKLPLFDAGVKYKPLGMSAKDMSYLGGRAYIKEAILNAFGQPLGLYSQEANRNNADAAILTYMKFTIRPRLQRIEEKINEQIIWRYDDKLFVMYDNPVPDDQAYKLEERIKHVNFGIESIHEVRKGLGKKPFPDKRLDEPILPVNMSSVDGIWNNIGKGNGAGNIVDSPQKMKELKELAES